MKNFYKIMAIISLLVLKFNLKAQDVPLGTMPMHYNSSFAGEGEGPRINSNLIYSSNSNYFRTIGFHTSYDQFVPEIGSGIGVSAGRFNTSGLFIKGSYSTIGLAIAPKFSVKGKLTISPSLDFHYRNQSDNSYHIEGYRTRTGLLMNTSRFFIGYSFDFFSSYKILNKTTSETEKRGKNITNMLNSSMQVGYTFQKTQDAKFAFTPQILIGFWKIPEYRLSINILKFMMNFRYDKVLWGISDDGLHIGWQTPRLRIMAFHNMDRIFEQGRRPQNTTLHFRYNFKK